MTPDFLIFVANIILCFSLFPSVFSKDKPHKNTSLLNVLVSVLFISAYLMAGFHWAVCINFCIGLCWGILLIQKAVGRVKK